jgi:hypothetical protein
MSDTSLESDLQFHSHYVRRSQRDPRVSCLRRPDVKELVQKIRTNHRDTIVLKLKNHVTSDINSLVLDDVIASLHKNRVCQALYVQNFSRALGDDQLDRLTKLLVKKKIWCLNLGENYMVSIEGWTRFCDQLPFTSVTHLYVSEHIIPLDLKNRMRANIRENRKKHNLHNSAKNLDVISKCTNMWWNPINAFRRPPSQPSRKRLRACDLEWTPDCTAYWAEGVGKGGEKPWTFRCKCGETCSSYESYRYHPTGLMFECTLCSVWSHVECIYGTSSQHCASLDDAEVYCFSCLTKRRRMSNSSQREMPSESLETPTDDPEVV